MNTKYHILNGDCLKEQFPKSIKDEVIVVRLCLVDGNVNAKNLDDLFKIRAKFISDNYEGFTENDYYKKAVIEIEKVKKLPENAEINLWFEDDLFCQVNFWFIIYLINENYNNQSTFLIRPKINSRYSFGNMYETELVSAFHKRKKIEMFEMTQLGKLWKLYQQNDFDEMFKIAEILKTNFPFLFQAIKAHEERIRLDRPTQSLIQIIKELKSVEFRLIFREFCKREPIYGFGDLQVKRIFDKINKEDYFNF